MESCYYKLKTGIKYSYMILLDILSTFYRLSNLILLLIGDTLGYMDFGSPNTGSIQLSPQPGLEYLSVKYHCSINGPEHINFSKYMRT